MVLVRVVLTIGFIVDKGGLIDIQGLGAIGSNDPFCRLLYAFVCCVKLAKEVCTPKLFCSTLKQLLKSLSQPTENLLNWWLRVNHSPPTCDKFFGLTRRIGLLKVAIQMVVMVLFNGELQNREGRQ